MYLFDSIPRLNITFLSTYLHITMISLIASDVSTGNIRVVLQLIEAVLRIQPTVGAALPAVKEATQLPSFLPDVES